MIRIWISQWYAYCHKFKKCILCCNYLPTFNIEIFKTSATVLCPLWSAYVTITCHKCHHCNWKIWSESIPLFHSDLNRFFSIIWFEMRKILITTFYHYRIKRLFYHFLRMIKWASEVRSPLINPSWDLDKIPLSSANFAIRLFSIERKFT